MTAISAAGTALLAARNNYPARGVSDFGNRRRASLDSHGEDGMIQQALKSLSDTPAPSLSLPERLRDVRQTSLEIARPLTAEDMTVQANDDASPTKWHLAHVTWFFETFLLLPRLPGYRRFDESFAYCFNSYYEGEGARHPRARRGLLTRPSCERVIAYRRHVDAALDDLLDIAGDDPCVAQLIELGINHEQQHQELMLTDILALFAASPLRPAYIERKAQPSDHAPDPLQWIAFPGGIRTVGSDAAGFAWDNELPRHDVLLRPYRLADRLVTNAEWLEFIADDGYRNPLQWLADGWATVQREKWEAPLYWERHDGEWRQMTLYGLQPLEPTAPVCHVSYFEADAFARWAGKRLPTEFEFEFATARTPAEQRERGGLQPAPAEPDDRRRLRQLFGETWQWTASAYLPYPGYKPPQGTIGEYNGKFMVSQHVLRGSSCVTPAGHSRATYRNFFYPHQRWQFSGVRLASEVGS